MVFSRLQLSHQVPKIHSIKNSQNKCFCGKLRLIANAEEFLFFEFFFCGPNPAISNSSG